MTTVYRSPQALVVVKGQPLPRVFGVRVTRGWDQALATAEIEIPYPPPAAVTHRGMIWVYMGAGTARLRFAGYITSIQNSIWPGRIILGCEDVLALAKYNKTLASYSLAGMTDEEAVRFILTTIDMPRFNPSLIGGTGKVIGTDTTNPALAWQPTESALAKIQQIDQLSIVDLDAGARKGIYRTFADAGGTIRRIPLDPLPSSSPAHTFTEGVDILSGSARIEAVEPTSTTMAAGYKGIQAQSAPTSNPWAVMTNPEFVLLPMVEEVDSATKANLQDMAAYLQQQRQYNVVRVEFVTHRDDLIGAYETERVVSDRAMVDLPAHLQSVVAEQGGRGGFRQQVSLISYRELNAFEGTDAAGKPLGPIGESDPRSDSEIPPEAPPALPGPGPEDVLASFAVKVLDQETVLVSGAYATLYTIACEDTSSSASGEIVAWAWEASGGTPTAGSERTFNPNFVGLGGASVALTVTDSNGNQGTTGPVDISAQMGAPVQQRTLYTAESDAVAAFDGSQWRTQPATSALAVANGPHWGASDAVLSSADDLATGPTSAVPLIGAIKSAWVESDVSRQKLAAGGTLGRIALSEDMGATWTPCTQLEDTAGDVLQVILSRSTPGQVWALQPSAIWISDDNGQSWRLIRAAAAGQAFISLRLTNFRNLVSSTGGPSPLERAEDTTAFTFPTPAPASITGVMANIYADELAAISGDTPPKLYVTDGEGSWNMVAAETPDLSAFSGVAPFPRNMQQDSSIARMGYVAVGAYALKTTDWWKPDTIHVLRHVGEGGAGSGPIAMVGVGATGDITAGTSGTRVYVSGAAGLYKSDDGGVTFSLVLPQATAGDPFLFRFDVVAGASGADVIYWVEGSGGGAVVKRSTDGGASWSTVTTPTGFTFDARSISCLSATEAFLADGGGNLYRTTNGGTSWTKLTLATLVEVVWAGTSKLWWSRRSDATHGSRANLDGTGEETFALTDICHAVHAVSDTVAYYFYGDIPFTATQSVKKVSGTTVSTITPTGGLPEAPWADVASVDDTTLLAFVCDVGERAAAADVGQIWKSTDGGASWTKVKEDADLYAQQPDAGSLAIDKALPAHAFCIGGKYRGGGTWAGDAPLWRSGDSGDTWEAATVAAGEQRLFQVRAVSG